MEKFTFRDYLESDSVKKAQEALDQNAAQKPGDYASQWQSQLDSLYGQIQDRKPFQYDINQDALYNQYKDQYVRNGKLAMMDTMGQAAALTGGYGSSYAQQVGQQAFQGYLQGLNDKVPELYQLALDQYNRQGDDLYRQYAMVGDREQQDYSRYQDAMNQWMNDRNYLTGVLSDERNFDYGQYQDDRNFGYQQYQDQLAQDQWERQFAEQLRQFNILHPQKKSGGGGGGGGGSSAGTNKQLPINAQSVLELGKGPISPETLSSLVKAGEVVMKAINGVNYAVKAATAPAAKPTAVVQTPSWVSTAASVVADPLAVFKKK